MIQTFSMSQLVVSHSVRNALIFIGIVVIAAGLVLFLKWSNVLNCLILVCLKVSFYCCTITWFWSTKICWQTRYASITQGIRLFYSGFQILPNNPEFAMVFYLKVHDTSWNTRFKSKSTTSETSLWNLMMHTRLTP